MYDLALAIHVIAVIVLFLAIGYATMGLGRMRRAGSAGDVAVGARNTALGALVSLAATMVLVAAAGELVRDRWSWSVGWIRASAVGVAIAWLLGLALVVRVQALGRAVKDAGGSGLSPALRRAAASPLLWAAAQVMTLLYVGVLLLMFVKPDGGAAAITLVVAALIGLAATAPAIARYRRFDAPR
jgi:hypothetical protein